MTGVQTCALPIWRRERDRLGGAGDGALDDLPRAGPASAHRRRRDVERDRRRDRFVRRLFRRLAGNRDDLHRHAGDLRGRGEIHEQQEPFRRRRWIDEEGLRRLAVEEHLHRARIFAVADEMHAQDAADIARLFAARGFPTRVAALEVAIATLNRGLDGDRRAEAHALDLAQRAVRQAVLQIDGGENDGAGLEKLFNKASKARQDLDAIE